MSVLLTCQRLFWRHVWYFFRSWRCLGNYLGTFCGRRPQKDRNSHLNELKMEALRLLWGPPGTLLGPPGSPLDVFGMVWRSFEGHFRAARATFWRNYGFHEMYEQQRKTNQGHDGNSGEDKMYVWWDLDNLLIFIFCILKNRQIYFCLF